ncbi:putative 28S ribosomal protein S6, mitochondrial [Halotydeus destructor]|nr:putative 28S ribosomal protein S6, mitochondrial [Halotydeus destructor]
MPSYELNFILRRMQRPEMLEILKRVGDSVLDNEGILRKVEFLGHRPLPWRMVNRTRPGVKRITQGSYFIYHCDLPPQTSYRLQGEYRLDPEFVKIRFLKKEENIAEDYVCTLDDEMKPPVFRPSVLKLIEEGRKKRITAVELAAKFPEEVKR